MTGQVRHHAGPLADAPVRQRSLRAHNLALAFRHIVAAGGQPISRIELSDRTGLTRPTITRIVDELLTGRLITESGATPYRGPGRPRVGLLLSTRGPAGLGLDIRADRVAACLVDLTGTVRHLAFRPLPRVDGPAAEVITALGDLAAEVTELASASELQVVRVTLAVPGAVSDGSLVRFAPLLGWREVDAGELLRGRLTAAVGVDNEANLAALAELYSGEQPDFAYVSGALDLGAGIVLDGRLLRGARGWSGELGHVTVYPDGRPCRCGARGCLQAYAGLEVLHAAAGDADLLAAADSGGAEMAEALECAGRALGIALAGVVNLVDVGTVLLGGSYALLASWLAGPLEAELGRRVLSCGWAAVEVRPAQLGPDAAVIGAALTSMEDVRRDPSSWLGRS